ncbi:MAG: GntR family transcriptional regulator [Azospirillaceae bacterium]|nr:GntR family transcriptional regulator [Azospirillaceae bacterium]
MRSRPALVSALDGLFPEPVKPVNLGDHAYEHLRELILSRQIVGGDEVPESKLAERLQVSRTPMREALVRLIGEGLLERANARTYRVRAVSTREFFECMQLRELLEGYAIECAVPLIKDADLVALRQRLQELGGGDDDDMQHWRFDNAFHSFFARVVGHDTLAETITRMRVTARLFRISSVFHRKAEIDEEHLAIIEAAERRDVPAAKAAMQAHLRNLQDHVRRAIAAETDPAGHFR